MDATMVDAAPKNPKILMVEDDPDVRRELESYLRDHGYAVESAGDGKAMREMIARTRFELVIMDLNLPGEDGLTLTQEIRRSSEIPVIMLTGRRETLDRVLGLELGADDYVTKPFDLRELLARVKSVLRRYAAAREAGAEAAVSTVEFEGWRLDLHSRGLTAPDGREVELTTAEFNLLEAFVKSPKRTLDRDYLLDRVHGRDWAPYDRSIDNLVHRLREKIGDDARHPKMIKSVRGVGYLFARDVRRG
jgi:two-component system OmpR family response regulator